MNLLLHGIYSGANAARYAERQSTFQPMSEEELSRINEQLKKQSVTIDGQEVTLQLTNEYIELEQLFNDFDKQKVEYENISFANYSSDQWAVFSKELYDGGFFKEMTDQEIYEIDRILMKMTDDIDGLRFNQGGIDIHSEKHQDEEVLSLFPDELDSVQAHFALSSSSNALRYFAENVLSGEMKDDFLGLVDDYYTTNSKNLEGYKSRKEAFHEMRAKYSEMYYFESVRRNLVEREESIKERKVNDILAKVKRNQSYMESKGKIYARYFKQMQESDSNVSELFKQLKNEMVSTYTNDVRRSDVSDVLNERNNEMFDQTEDYWNEVKAFSEAFNR